MFFPSGGQRLPSFGDSYYPGVGSQSRAQTLQRGEWPAEGAARASVSRRGGFSVQVEATNSWSCVASADTNLCSVAVACKAAV